MRAPNDNCNREKLLGIAKLRAESKSAREEKMRPQEQGMIKLPFPYFQNISIEKKYSEEPKKQNTQLFTKLCCFIKKKNYSLNAVFALLECRVNHSLFHRESSNQLSFKPDFKLWYPGHNNVRNIYKKQKHFVKKSYQDEQMCHIHARAL